KPIFTAMLNDAGARANTDIYGTHFYGVYRPSLSDPALSFQWPRFEEIGRPAGKELWMTEVYTPNNHDGNIWDASKEGDAMKTARMIHYSKVAGGFSTWVWWYIHRFYGVLHDGKALENTTALGANGQVTKRGWITAQYSKFIRPGFHRVETSPSRFGSSDDTRTFISAYQGDDGTVVIVAVNMNSSAQSVNFSVSEAVGTMEAWRTSGTENLAKQADINVSGKAFSASLPGRSVTTFVGSRENTSSSSSSEDASSSSSSENVSSSSSENASSSSSSSSNEETPILSTSHSPLATSQTPEYYNLRGKKVYGTLPSGVYIEKKQGMPSKIFVVK
ncbi:MAG: hypothetical protein FWC26_09800, partial [Fibromonadales bacterium]|nr:hypothetical protein [Fibromonadales bacterium]